MAHSWRTHHTRHAAPRPSRTAVTGASWGTVGKPRTQLETPNCYMEVRGTYKVGGVTKLTSRIGNVDPEYDWVNAPSDRT